MSFKLIRPKTPQELADEGYVKDQRGEWKKVTFAPSLSEAKPFRAMERSPVPVGCDFCPGINPSYAQQIDGKWWCTCCDRTLRAEDVKGLCPNCEDKSDVLVLSGRVIRCGQCGVEAPVDVWAVLPRRKDFHAELLALAAWANGLCEAANGEDDFEQGRAAAHGATAEYTHGIARKYAPAEPEKRPESFN